MKNIYLYLIAALLLCCSPTKAAVKSITSNPDSIYLFSYAQEGDEGRGGLKLAWSPDQQKWFAVGDGYSFVKCDYGRWGAEKRMFKPQLTWGTDGQWHCTWQINPSGNEWAYASSPDLIQWSPQHYYYKNGDTPSFVAATVAVPASINLHGEQLNGYVQKRPYADVVKLDQYADHRAYKHQLHNERTEQDGVRFAGLQPVNASIQVSGENALPISEHLIGIFFEDINYAADGGLYGELIQNRDFEYSPKDGSPREGWNSTYAWNMVGNNASLNIQTENPIHENNANYAVVNVVVPGAALVNSGWDGIPVKQGDKYDFSMFAKTMNGASGKVVVKLLDAQGNAIAQGHMNVSKAWKKQGLTLTANKTVDNATLAIYPQTSGEYAFDMVSLFPQKTFKNRKNGLRNDLAQTLADMNPRFVRFPGGCVAHGDGIDNIYDWKGSIGPLEARKPLRNLWGYHQTRGLGYHEYFLFCEDLGAEPVPVVAAGVPCQNSGTCSHHSNGELSCGGQQGGIPMAEMDQYVQDVLDLIEYANGDAKKTVWGKKRAEAGHPKPFNLKYVGIGNEDLITDIFEERFKMIYDAVQAKYPEIIVIGTTGPFYEGTDYVEGWKLANKYGVPMVDEHYYNTPGWFINNQDFYDKYDRNSAKVYLGEYAAHLPNRANNIETALAEALYLTAVERNADVVTMTSYAPLLAKEGYTQWSPDLIYFNNTEVKPTVGYYAQQMYGKNAGTLYLPATMKVDNHRKEVKNRIASSVVKDEVTGDLIVKLVNLLPVAVNTDIALPTLEGMNTTATKTVLSSDPTDTKAKPTEVSLEVSEQFNYEMPSYSFTVIRIPAMVKKK